MSRWENAMMEKNLKSSCGRYNEADPETDETRICAMRMSKYIDDDGRLLRVKSFMNNGMRPDEGG
jgi:hypothetical protein